jgi:hypothetical protein
MARRPPQYPVLDFDAGPPAPKLCAKCQAARDRHRAKLEHLDREEAERRERFVIRMAEQVRKLSPELLAKLEGLLQLAER